jgi:hypothetical protein
MFKLKSASLIVHLIGWLIVISITTLFLSENRSVSQVFLSAYLWLFFLIYVGLFYLNTLWLIPGLYFKRKYITYFVIITSLLLIIIIIKPFDNLLFERNRLKRDFYERREMRELPPPVRKRPPGFLKPMPPPDHQSGEGIKKVDAISIFLFGLIWALGMAMKVSERLKESEQRAIRAEADKANAELSFLKAQINPHFLFNTLNNIYSLAVIQSKNTAESVMKLSQIMRYVTDEVSEDFVPLQSEIACISNYIDLQKLRLSQKTKVNFEVSGNTELTMIAPLLLLTFVENAFKHGISNHENSFIEIRIVVETTTIRFECRNTLFSIARKVERTGIGLANTRQRLEHLYKNRYRLAIDNQADVYQVLLTIIDEHET